MTTMWNYFKLKHCTGTSFSYRNVLRSTHLNTKYVYIPAKERKLPGLVPDDKVKDISCF